MSPGMSAGLVCTAILIAAGRRSRLSMLLVVVSIGAVSGVVATGRESAVLTGPIPEGRGTLSGTAATDSLPFGDRYQFVIRPTGWQPGSLAAASWQGPPIRIITEADYVVAGDRVICVGPLRTDPGYVRGNPVAGRLTAHTIEIPSSAEAPVMVAGNLLRARVQSRMSAIGDSPSAALLSGFLIGDIANLPTDDEEALRRSGLTHFVAVSGSNVALVLGAWWLVVGPLGAGTRLRALTGLVVLAVFVVATRWESSVIRAATMAGLVLGGKALGVPMDAWTSLGVAVTVLLAVSGDLAIDIGFQLSVAATAGVLVGMRWWRGRSPRIFWTALSATAGAQIAVVPLLILHFGSVPLLSPLANLLVAPLVTVATALAGVGVVVSWNQPLLLAEQVADWILRLARVAGEWPQLDAGGVVAIGGLAVVAYKTKMTPFLVAGGLLVATVSAVPPGPPDVATVTFLDVGQGDAVLLRDPSGATALVDGGADPGILRTALRRHGVQRIDLLVASHGDADHVGGFQNIEQSMNIGTLWIPADQEISELLRQLIDSLGASGTSIDEISAGGRARLGQFTLEVVGPQRRYAAENDGSIVLLVEADGVSVLLPGDIGAIAQLELPSLRPDVLLVPHHGAGTTNLDWLADTVGNLAVISVGPNTYGHPTAEVIATLEAAGAEIRATADIGDVVVPLVRSQDAAGELNSTLVGP